MLKRWIATAVLASGMAGVSPQLCAQPLAPPVPSLSAPPPQTTAPFPQPTATQPASGTPLTLDAALRGLVMPAAVDTTSPDVAAALAARPGIEPGLQSDVAVAPDIGVPAKFSLTQQIRFEVGSRARRLGRAHTIRAAAAQALASIALARRGAAQDVVAAFFAVAGDQAQLAASAQNVSLGRRTLEAARQRHRIGVGPRVDEDRAGAALRTSEADFAAANAALAADRDALAMLLSQPVGATVALPAAAEIPAPGVVDDRVLHTSPLVLAAMTELQAAQAALLVTRAESAPGISLGAGAGLTGDGTSRTVGPVVSATLSLPLSTSLVRAERGVAAAQVAAATVALDQARRDAVANALRLRAQALAAAGRIAPLRDALASAGRVAQATLSGYRLGAVGSNELIDAQTQFSAARTALDAAVLQGAQALATLQIEMGDLPA